jgi:hypothetical protein
MTWDAPTISAFAAAAAALAAGTVAAIQLYIGVRQSRAALVAARAAMMTAESEGRHTVASFRQKWIEAVRDTLSEHHSIVMSLPEGHAVSPEDQRKLAALRTKLQLLLNPDEPDSLELLRLIEEIVHCRTVDRILKDGALSRLAQKILKTEWVRIKDELQKQPPAEPETGLFVQIRDFVCN